MPSDHWASGAARWVGGPKSVAFGSSIGIDLNGNWIFLFLLDILRK